MLFDFKVTTINSFSEICPNTSWLLLSPVIKYMKKNIQEVALQERCTNDPEFPLHLTTIATLAIIPPDSVTNAFGRL